MPCYSVRTVSVEFRVANIELLKKALEKVGWKVNNEIDNGALSIMKKDGSYMDSVSINFDNSKISSRYMDEKKLTDFSYELKRAYSEQVISEVAKKQKWMSRKLSDNKFQLQKF